jgi:hypothetical protein
MAPPSPYRPLNVALVLALCAVILSARLLMGYMHAGGSVSPVLPAPAESTGHFGELPPLW